MVIPPLDESAWTPLLEAKLPKGHKIHFTDAAGVVIVRISGPNAHVIGHGTEIEEAVQAAFDWFESVGREL